MHYVRLRCDGSATIPAGQCYGGKRQYWRDIFERHELTTTMWDGLGRMPSIEANAMKGDRIV